jgi:hypothetical protein
MQLLKLAEHSGAFDRKVVLINIVLGPIFGNVAEAKCNKQQTRKERLTLEKCQQIFQLHFPKPYCRIPSDTPEWRTTPSKEMIIILN